MLKQGTLRKQNHRGLLHSDLRRVGKLLRQGNEMKQDESKNWPVNPDNMEHGKYWQEGITVVAGCTHISAGCANCWAADMEHRFRKHGLTAKSGKWTGKIKVQEHLLKRCYSKKPKVIAFWNDIFHKGVPDSFYEKLMTAIADNPQHVYLIMTKRPQLIPDFFSNISVLKNVFLGVTIENMASMNRLKELNDRWLGKTMLSIEPLLELLYINLTHLSGIDWVVIGAESGTNRRSCKLEWVKSIVAQCSIAHVPVFVKQVHIDGKLSKDISKWPDSLRYREVPKVIRNEQPKLEL
jgi:protein gp37